jgi:hypothetical protein
LELALALGGDAAATYRARAGHVVSNLSRHQGKKLLTTLLMPPRTLQPKPLPACTQAPAESNRFIGELA